ncbi:hypothetical protein [Candidatus Similichlamydia laticola]|uniref:Uncharacterized protein n=1 Tax=Candidatus Similichlamydia laticola TaxID=2170265 RepID=A0A369KCY3_9BACT|nr:hypothetical protein [Candidatus Similichlamydia laticola]RDB31462.1 hypothetical protein HAT2_00433 [Candidatus Similichlamydia laticola]
MAGKSERLRKLEEERANLEQWLKLGLVPKKELSKYLQEAEDLKARIEEEKERLQALKEIGHSQDYAPVRRQVRGAYADNPTIGTLGEASSSEGHSDASDTGYHQTDHNRGFTRRDLETTEGLEDAYTDVSSEDHTHDCTHSSRQQGRNWHGLRDPDAYDEDVFW